METLVPGMLYLSVCWVLCAYPYSGRLFKVPPAAPPDTLCTVFVGVLLDDMYQTCKYIDNDQVFQKCLYLLLPTARQTSPSLWLNHVVPSTWFRFCGIHSAPTLNVLRKYRFWQYSTSNCMSSRASGRCATNEGPPGAATVYFRIVYTPGT